MPTRKTAKKPVAVKQPEMAACANRACKLRASGCQGNEYCPGYLRPEPRKR